MCKSLLDLAYIGLSPNLRVTQGGIQEKGRMSLYAKGNCEMLRWLVGH